MIINRRENITKNCKCEDIYSILIDEIGCLINNNTSNKHETSISNTEQNDPFIEQTDSGDSVDTFISAETLKTHIKETVKNVFEGTNNIELNKFLALIVQIKNGSIGKTVKFVVNTTDFLVFLKLFAQNIKQAVSPIENLIQLLEVDKNREIVKPFAIKYFKVIFYLQKPTKSSFYELSIMNNLLKVNYFSDRYSQSVLNFILKDYTLNLCKKYSCNTRIEMYPKVCVEFCKILETAINGFNGSIIELETEANEISKVIFTMLIFFLNKHRSIFNELYGVKELFYCALRSVYQGRMFAKRLECMVSSKLRWKLAMDNEEYTVDKVYQTLFKYEYLCFIGKVRYGIGNIYSHTYRQNENSGNKDSFDENQRVMVTKIIQTTPKTNKGETKYAFSPLSRRIGEKVQRNEGLSSKRKLKFDD